jgi:glycosyltransferase involved in cell wall biosynthesis
VRRPVICILALSRINDDPRARRQGDAFWKAGWQVIGIGLRGGASPPPVWPVGQQEDNRSKTADCRTSSRFRRISRPLRGYTAGRIRDGAGLLAARLSDGMALQTYWRLYADACEIYNRAIQIHAEVWLANDWTMLPVARRLAEEKGGFYGYDSHELATEEFGDRLRWRFWRRPLVRAIEQHSIGGAMVVSAVSEGIAKRLQDFYSLPRLPVVIRNTPPFEEINFRATAADRIRVLYHGIVTPGRGIEATIDSVSDWRPEFDLTLRGPGDAHYLDALRHRIAERSLADRVVLSPAVPMTALVREAAAFDLGFFALPGSSRHNEFALPNKFFEYVMAGLALCITDLPEMARLIRDYELGVTFPSIEPEAIAAAVNTLDPERIDRYKRNALAAARELCWEQESERLLAPYDALFDRRSTNFG